MADAYVVKPGEGSVWPNDNRTKDWHADWQGKILLPDGTEHYIDAWDNDKNGVPLKSSNGTSWRKIKIGNPVAGANTGTQVPVQNTNQASQSVADQEDDLPF